jgi:hypothetical protein
MDEPSARRILREVAEDSSRVIFVSHAEHRMAQRGISTAQIMRALRNGWIVEGPLPDPKMGQGWRLTLETISAGDPLQVVVTIYEDESGNQALVITAYWSGR